MNFKYYIIKYYIIAILLVITPNFKIWSQNNGVINITYEHSAEYELAGLTVTSPSETIDKSYVIFISGLVLGDVINVPGDAITEAIKKLWKEKVYSNIKITATKIEDKKIYLDIYVEERPRLKEYTFRGIKKSDQDNIRDIIKLYKGEIVTQNLINFTRNQIKDYLHDKSYLQATIDIQEIYDTTVSKNTITLLIDIDKGEKVKIKTITITGNQAISDERIKRKMKKTIEKSRFLFFNDLKYTLLNPRSAFRKMDQFIDENNFYPGIIAYARQRNKTNIFKSSKFNEEDFEEDKERVISLYNANGYRDARIVSDRVRYEGGNMFIDIEIEEGAKYYLRNVYWIGNSKYKTEDLNRITGFKKGDVYNQDKINEALFFNPNGLDISSLYQDVGYLFFSITPVEIAVEGDSIDLELRIYEGKQARINKVTVSGNTKTKEHVILREVRSKPGELFSRSDIIRTQQMLGQMGYFNPQALDVIPKPDPANGTVDLEYVVEEAPSDQIELSGGWGNRMLIGTLGVSFNNFSTKNIFKKNAWRPLPSGDGQRLSLRGQSNGRFFQSYNFSFTEPWLGGKKPISFTLGFFHTINNTGFFGGGNAQSRIKTTSVNVGLGKRLRWPDDFFNVFSNLRYEVFNLREFAIVPGYSNGRSHKVSLTLSLARNSTNDFIFPTKGSNISISTELTPPYSVFNDKDYQAMDPSERFNLLEYHKWKFNAQFFSGIGGSKLEKRLVLFNRADFGILGFYTERYGYSPFERFMLGGDGLTGIGFNNMFLGREIIALRGYENNSLTPGFRTPEGPFGGTVFTRYTSELRFLVSPNPSAKIFILAFLEAGNSWENLKEFTPFRVNRSVGGGVRIFLPMFGLMGVDYGWGFDPLRNTPEDQRQRGHFHFMIGQQF